MVLPLIVNARASHGRATVRPRLERFHVADAGFRERRQFDVDLRTRSCGKLAPLANSGGSERDLFHAPIIA
jgi:hypothetical protein